MKTLNRNPVPNTHPEHSIIDFLVTRFSHRFPDVEGVYVVDLSEVSPHGVLWKAEGPVWIDYRTASDTPRVEKDIAAAVAAEVNEWGGGLQAEAVNNRFDFRDQWSVEITAFSPCSRTRRRSAVLVFNAAQL